MTIRSGGLRRETNKAHQQAKRKREHGTAYEVFFAPSPRPPEEPIIIFHHIPKTAGTSLRQVIHRNYVNAGMHHKVYSSPAPHGADAEWTARFVGSLTATELASIVCVAAHGANHLMNQLNRPTQAVTFLRDPVERVISKYYFKSPPDFTLLEFYSALDAVGEEVKAHHLREYCNPQSRSLLTPKYGADLWGLGLTSDCPGAELWRKRLFRLVRNYMVGLQDRFEESLLYFGCRLGWTDLFLPNAKFNTERPRQIDDELKAAIQKYNWLDQELYQYFASRPLGARS